RLVGRGHLHHPEDRRRDRRPPGHPRDRGRRSRHQPPRRSRSLSKLRPRCQTRPAKSRPGFLLPVPLVNAGFTKAGLGSEPQRAADRTGRRGPLFPAGLDRAPGYARGDSFPLPAKKAWLPAVAGGSNRRGKCMRSTRSVPLSLPSDTLKRLVRRNLSAILGLALLALAGAIAASLATWTVDDPSLSHATDHDARNVLGVPGAIVADLVMQFLGLAGIVLLLPPVVWAWRLVFGEPSRFSWRTALSWVAGALVAALALATLPVFGTWPLPSGIGGVTGDLLLKVPAFFGASPAGVTNAILGIVFAAAAVLFTLKGAGLSLFRRRMVEVAERAPKVKPSPRTAIAEHEFDFEADADEYEEDDLASDGPPGERGEEMGDDDSDRPGRLTMALGVLSHVAFSTAGAIRRLGLGRKAVRLAGLAFRRADEDLTDYGARREPRLAPMGEAADGDDDMAGASGVPDAHDEADLFIGEDDLAEAPAPQVRRRQVTPPAARPRPARRPPPPKEEPFELPPVTLLSEPKPGERKHSVNTAAL